MTNVATIVPGGVNFMTGNGVTATIDHNLIVAYPIDLTKLRRPIKIIAASMSSFEMVRDSMKLSVDQAEWIHQELQLSPPLCSDAQLLEVILAHDWEQNPIASFYKRQYQRVVDNSKPWTVDKKPVISSSTTKSALELLQSLLDDRDRLEEENQHLKTIVEEQQKRIRDLEFKVNSKKELTFDELQEVAKKFKMEILPLDLS